MFTLIRSNTIDQSVLGVVSQLISTPFGFEGRGAVPYLLPHCDVFNVNPLRPEDLDKTVTIARSSPPPPFFFLKFLDSSLPAAHFLKYG